MCRAGGASVPGHEAANREEGRRSRGCRVRSHCRGQQQRRDPQASGRPAVARTAALAAVVAAKYARMPPPKATASGGDFELEDKGGQKTVGQIAYMRALAAAKPDAKLRCASEADGKAVDTWVAVAAAAVTKEQLPAINAYLSTRTYLVGHEVTLADIALWDAIQGTFNFRCLF